MFVTYNSSRSRAIRASIRNFYSGGKRFATPITEEIVFKAICVNIRQRRSRWRFMEQISSSLTHSLVNRVIQELKICPQLALEFLNWVGEKRSVLHSLESYCTVIHVLVNARRFEDAMSLMRKLILKFGIHPLELVEALLDSFDTSPSSPAVFDSLVRACTQIGSTEDCYRVIKKLEHKGFRVTVHAWNNFLNHLLKLNNIGKFWSMHTELITKGYSENLYTFNLVICALSKECKLREAISIIYQMLKRGVLPNVVSLNMLIEGASGIGDVDLSIGLLKKIMLMQVQSLKPNVVTYNCLINGCCRCGNLKVAEEVRTKDMVEMGIKPNARTYAILVNGYLRNGNIENALDLCNEMVEIGLTPIPIVYNSIIHYLCEEGDMQEASLLLSDMSEKSLVPDQFTYSILAEGFCRIGCLNEAMKCHTKIIEKNIPLDAYSYNILINHLCKQRDGKGVKQMLGSMFARGVVPDQVTYSILVGNYCKEGHMENAIQVYDEMINEGKLPNLITYNSVVNGLCKDSSLEIARHLVEVLQRRSLSPDVVTYNTLVTGYCRIGKLDEAFGLCSTMRQMGIPANCVTYNVLINFLCKFGYFHLAKSLLKKMILQGLSDMITYTTVISHGVKNCSASEVIELHDSMVLGGVVPDGFIYKRVVSPLIQEETIRLFKVEDAQNHILYL